MARYDSSEAVLGNRKLMQDKNIDIRGASADLEKLESEGKTAMFLAKDAKLIGLLASRDTLKEFAKETVDKLKRMAKQVIMISGDNKKTAMPRHCPGQI